LNLNLPPTFFSRADTNASLGSTVKRWLKKLAIATGLFTVGFGTGRYTYTPPAPYVERIIDGDTFILNNDKEIRVFGIDAPEKGQPFYEEAQARLRQLLKGKTPGEDLDVKSKSSSFGRQVAILEVNDKDIGAIMVKEGLAFSELKYGKDKYRSEEDEAIKAKRGVWTLPNGGERPWDFRAKKGKKVSWMMKNPLELTPERLNRGEFCQTGSVGPPIFRPALFSV
jgi:endonuclease YncB( thermonuclease family)